jgi:hypothetical protein
MSLSIEFGLVKIIARAAVVTFRIQNNYFWHQTITNVGQFV